MTHIFLHGLGQTSSAWQETVRALSLDPAPLCPDLFSLPPGKDIGYPDLYASFSAYCRSLPDPLHLCGLSLGGLLALQYTAEHPRRVGSLVLIGTPYKLPRGLMALQNMIFRFMPSTAFAKMGLTKKQVLRLTGSLGSLDPSRNLDKVLCPTLVLCGESDSANKKAGRQTAACIPHAEFQLIPGAGHEANLDKPRELALLIGTFFSSI